MTRNERSEKGARPYAQKRHRQPAIAESTGFRLDTEVFENTLSGPSTIKKICELLRKLTYGEAIEFGSYFARMLKKRGLEITAEEIAGVLETIAVEIGANGSVPEVGARKGRNVSK